LGNKSEATEIIFFEYIPFEAFEISSPIRSPDEAWIKSMSAFDIS